MPILSSGQRTRKNERKKERRKKIQTTSTTTNKKGVDGDKCDGRCDGENDEDDEDDDDDDDDGDDGDDGDKFIGQFDINYIIFRNVEIFKNYLFQNQKIL